MNTNTKEFPIVLNSHELKNYEKSIYNSIKDELVNNIDKGDIEIKNVKTGEVNCFGNNTNRKKRFNRFVNGNMIIKIDKDKEDNININLNYGVE